jgi:hypothetical protein
MRFKTPLKVKAADPDFLDPSSGWMTTMDKDDDYSQFLVNPCEELFPPPTRKRR